MAKEAQSENGHLDFQQEPLKAIAKEMGGAERVLQGILETSESIIFIKDLDGRYVLVNPAFSRLFHRGLEETLGHTDADLFPQKVAQRLRAADARVLKSREILSSIDRLTIEHEEHIFVATKAPLQDNEGNVIGVSGFATEITGEVRARDQLAHLNKILRAIRNVNQLIVTEKDPERLLQGACERLVKDGSYHSAWIALLDDSGQLVTAAESGFGGDFAPMLEQLRQGIIPQCGKDALANPGVISVFHPQRDCSGCPLAASCAGRVKSAVRLAYGGKVFGFLVLSLQSKYAQDPKERALISEIAGDLGFALHDLEIEEERQQSEERYRLIVRNAHSGIIIVDERYRFQWVNDVFCKMLARDKAEIVGRDFRDFLDDESRQLVADRYVRRQRGEDIPSRYEFNVVRKDGTKRRVEISSAVVRDQAERMRTIAQLLDITSYKETEAKLRKSLSDIMRVLSATIKIRNPYTAGHQVRVAKLAVAIATEMKLPEDRVEGVRFAAQVHDIGKVAIPAEILAKPTALNEIEFSLIKEHPEVAYDVLRDIDFPWPIANIVLQHHERIDGSGYPNGLKNGDILLEARILGVADVVEAMSSHRPYRASLGLDAALDEIKKNKGRLYDPEVVDACLAVFQSGFTFK